MTGPVRILAVVAGLSLAANLFLLGLWIGGRWAPVPPGGDGHRRFRVELTASQEALPPELRRPLMERLARTGGDLGRRLAEYEQAQQAVRAALAAEPFDPQRLEQAFAALRAAGARLQRPVQRSLAQLAGELDPESRRELARHLRTLLQHRAGGLASAGRMPPVPAEEIALIIASPRYRRLAGELAALEAQSARLAAALAALEGDASPPAPGR